MKEIAARLPHGAIHEFKKLFYDVASVTNPISMSALLALAPLSQVLFGSDYPFIEIDTFSSQLQTLGLAPAQLAAIERENAARLFPKYA
jgi:predicted TIM-barrel fold metal-dependent hydrolase